MTNSNYENHYNVVSAIKHIKHTNHIRKIEQSINRKNFYFKYHYSKYKTCEILTYLPNHWSCISFCTLGINIRSQSFWGRFYLLFNFNNIFLQIISFNGKIISESKQIEQFFQSWRERRLIIRNNLPYVYLLFLHLVS